MLGSSGPRCRKAAGLPTSDETIVFWNGARPIWAWLRNGNSVRIVEEFVLELDLWDQLCADVEAWLMAPQYSQRPEQRRWLQNPQ